MVVKGRQEAQAVEGILPIKESSRNDTWNTQFVKVLSYDIKIKVLGRSPGEKASYNLRGFWKDITRKVCKKNSAHISAMRKTKA